MTCYPPGNAFRVAALGWFLLGSIARSAPPPDLPAAIFTDPPPDAVSPASGRGVQFKSHGAQINGQLYRPSGAETHPTAIILNGLPGNEQNLDLAQAIRRAGWTVLTFHYTGSWGSGGRFTLHSGIDDAVALLAYLQKPENAKSWGVDPKRIVVLGHSYGGYVAARAAIEFPSVIGVVLIAPWDISVDARKWKLLSPARRKEAALEAFDDVNGRIAGASSLSLLREIMSYGSTLNLAKLGTSLVCRPLLLITATRDDDDDKAEELTAGLHESGTTKLTTVLMDTDHSFNTRRIALQTTILRWLAALPEGPPL